ncbi:MAG: type II secretion system inner membrane protein GspF [Succinivibrionaceae bacterium]|jgi:general secretion pathway protein F|nr:type II secretion system inner membrane protein GspF [Succinivibrionaceae bacterium]
MASFSYVALTPEGRRKKGIIEADSEKQVRQKLRKQSLVPVEVKSAAGQLKGDTGKGSRFTLMRTSMNSAALCLATRQLATLVEATIPVEEALATVAEQCEKPGQKALLSEVRSQVLEGKSLAEALSRFPRVFSRLYRSMVAAGEKSGHLDTVLERLADYTENQQKIKAKIIQAMIYPTVLTLVAVGVIIVLLTSVVPKVVSQFAHMKRALPTSTNILIAISDFLRDYGLYIGIALIVIIFAIGALLRKPSISMKWDTVILGMPVVGKVAKGLNTARFARTLAILNSSAVPLLDGMKISGEVLSNAKARELLQNAASEIREGRSLHEALTATGLFPPMMLHMIAAGEKSGELDSMLKRAADSQDSEFERLVSMALSIFEPMLIVSMAGVVLFIVMSILQPILQMNSMV